MSLLTFDINVSEIMQDPNNARKHDGKNLDAIKGSLAKFGQQKPIVIDEKNIVLAGNGTLSAARSLGWKTITAVRSALKGYDATAYALADNRSSELAEWDQEILDSQLQALSAFDFPLMDIGFDMPSLDDDGGGKTDDDAVPETPENFYGVKRGDIWLLGTYLECDNCKAKVEYDKAKADQVCEACNA